MNVTIYKTTLVYGLFEGVVLSYEPMPRVHGMGRRGEMESDPSVVLAEAHVPCDWELVDGVLYNGGRARVEPETVLAIALATA